MAMIIINGVEKEITSQELAVIQENLLAINAKRFAAERRIAEMREKALRDLAEQAFANDKAALMAMVDDNEATAEDIENFKR